MNLLAMAIQQKAKKAAPQSGERSNAFLLGDSKGEVLF